MGPSPANRTEYKSGARVAVVIFGFMLGLTALLLVLKLLLG